MTYSKPLRGAAMMLLLPLSAACVHTAIDQSVPECERLIPEQLLEDTPGADIPTARALPDGHDDAQPWQVGFIQQTGQLQVANEKPRAVDHIYSQCLALHREAARKANSKFLGIF